MNLVVIISLLHTHPMVSSHTPTLLQFCRVYQRKHPEGVLRVFPYYLLLSVFIALVFINTGSHQQSRHTHTHTHNTHTTHTPLQFSK
jgi:hypothetical protein